MFAAKLILIKSRRSFIGSKYSLLQMIQLKNH